MYHYSVIFFLFFFNDTATTEIYTLSLHDALPISFSGICPAQRSELLRIIQCGRMGEGHSVGRARRRSEEHTSELQSQSNLVCRLLLEKKKKAKEEPRPIATEPQAPKDTNTSRPQC